MQQSQAAGEQMLGSTQVCHLSRGSGEAVAQLYLQLHQSLIYMASSLTSKVILSEAVLN